MNSPGVVVRRYSLDDIRDRAVSPAPSVRGLYARSRATSPTNDYTDNLGGMIFHPDQRYTEYVLRNPITPVNSYSHLTTSFATLFHEKQAREWGSTSNMTSTYPLNASSSSAVTRRAWDTADIPTEKPPGYTDAQERPRSILDEDTAEVIVYMQEERLARSTSIPRPRTPLGHLPGTSVRDIPSVNVMEEPLPIPPPRVQHSVSFAATDSYVTVRRVTGSEDLRSLHTPRISFDQEVSYDTAGISFFEDDDEEECSATPPVKKQGSWVMKQIKKRFKPKTEGVQVSDTVSSRSENFQSEAWEKTKSSSTSLFNMKTSVSRAPSIKSTKSTMSASKKKVGIFKGRKQKTTPIPTTETSLLTSSSRAVENKIPRPRSSSFSGYASSRTEWIPEGIDQNQYEHAANLRPKEPARGWGIIRAGISGTQ